jgi:hypothetical protein
VILTGDRRGRSWARAERGDRSRPFHPERRDDGGTARGPRSAGMASAPLDVLGVRAPSAKPWLRRGGPAGSRLTSLLQGIKRGPAPEAVRTGWDLDRASVAAFTLEIQQNNQWLSPQTATTKQRTSRSKIQRARGESFSALVATASGNAATMHTAVMGASMAKQPLRVDRAGPPGDGRPSRPTCALAPSCR